MKYFTFLLFFILLSSCKSTYNYNYIQKYFPENLTTKSKFLRACSVCPEDSRNADTVLIQERIIRKKNGIYYEIIIDSSIFALSIDSRQVIVLADSNKGFNSLYKQVYSRRINNITNIPKNNSIEGNYKEFNEDNSLRLNISWPHPYYLYFTFDGKDLIVHKFTTNKIELPNTYSFSETHGLYKIIQEIGPFIYIANKINNAQ